MYRSVDANPPQAPSILGRLEEMSAEQRLAASRDGSFDRRERVIWAANYPDEVPLINGEFEWIALAGADLD